MPKNFKYPKTDNAEKLHALLHVLSMFAIYIDLSAIKNVH